MPSLEEGSGSGNASGASSGMMERESSRLSEISETASRGYGTQYLASESTADIPLQERNQERVPGQAEAAREHEHAYARGVGHAYSSSLSTVTGSPPHPRGGSSDVQMGGVFPSPAFGSGSSYPAQTNYSVHQTPPHYGSAQQHVQPQVPALVHTRISSQEPYQYGPVSALYPTSGFTSPQGRSNNQAQPRPMVEPQGQARVVAPTSRAPPVRTSTKRPRAPKRLRQDPSMGIGHASNMAGSDSDSDEDEIEWIPGSDDGGGASGAGVNQNARMGELGGTGGRSGQAAPGPTGGRKCVSVLFRLPLSSSFSLVKYEVDADAVVLLSPSPFHPHPFVKYPNDTSDSSWLRWNDDGLFCR